MKRSRSMIVGGLIFSIVASMAIHAVAQNQPPKPPRPNAQRPNGQRPDPLQNLPRPPAANTSAGQPWSVVTTQPSYGGYGGGYGGGWGGWGGGGGTVAGNYMQGMASAVRAAGDYNLSTSQAAVNMEEAQRRDIINRESWTNAYFEMRRTNEAYREAARGPRGTSEDWVRLAREAAPARLSPGELDTVSGEINWPRLLQRPEFNDSRKEIERLYAERADRGGSIGPSGYSDIQSSTSAMIDYLKANITKYQPNEYLNAKKFLESLAYEARFTTG